MKAAPAVPIPLEKAVVARIQKLLKDRGAYAIKTTGVRIVGTPDILCCYRGCFIGIEVKRPGGRATVIQEERLREIQRAGGYALVADNTEDVKALLDVIDTVKDLSE